MASNLDDRVTYIGRTTHRNSGLRFGIRTRDRRSHMYIIGKTGTGKSHLLKRMIAQDIAAGEGCALFDPHGQLAAEVRDLVPPHRLQDLYYINPVDPLSTWRFNPFAHVSPDKRALAAAGMIETFKKLWPDDWGPRLEHLLRNVVFTLLEVQGSSIADVPRLLVDRHYRSALTANLSDPIVRSFWKDEFERYSPGFKAVVIAPLQNKIGALLTDPVSRRFLTEPGILLDIRRTMDDGKILLVNLDKGAIGEGSSTIVGSLILSAIALAGISRSDQGESKRKDFMVYLDEFQTFTTLSLASMLSELRKYRITLTLANQHISQLEPAIRDAVFGNTGTIISFRVGAEDAPYLAREFASVFSPMDLLSLERYTTCVRLLINGEQCRPFSATTLDGLV